MVGMDEISRILLVNDVFNAVGGLCGLVVVVLILGLARFDGGLLDRFSIRFSLAISLVDFLKALAIVLSGKATYHPSLCILSAFSVNWLLLVYLFLNVAIAANLQMVFLSGRVCTRSRERISWILCLAMATVIMLVPLGKNGLKFLIPSAGQIRRRVWNRDMWVYRAV
ncbi:hypothetical protein DSO57_1021039 [Entomophthora muscae]|uniref:Uncharacterized protein n=1 Tax=Entomophthora muscae TaxID=34485 RepID=A0ACC2SGH7_9FUNG|nr:hypothetical protein DSO57_1021039 [Entomophthora muscae]